MGKKDERKYYIIIERTSKSRMTNMDERDDKIDSVLTTSVENAYDSCIGRLYGMRVADSILLQILNESDKNENYPYSGWKVLGYKIINEGGIDVSDFVGDSVRKTIHAYWHFPEKIDFD